MLSLHPMSIWLLCVLTLPTFLGLLGMTPDAARSSDPSAPKGPIDTNRRGGVRSWRPEPTITTSDTSAEQIPKIEVKATQEALKQKGYNPGPVDGILGARTSDALREFQKAQGLVETGRLDAATRNKLGL